LTRFDGNYLLVLSIILLAGWFVSLFIDVSAYVATASWIIFVFVLVAGIIYSNTGGRFKARD